MKVPDDLANANCLVHYIRIYDFRHLFTFIKLAGPLFLTLRGTPIDGDGFVDVEDIGTYSRFNNMSNGLLCHTNETSCCTSAQTPAGIGGVGVWQFPNGTILPTVAALDGGAGFGRDRGQSVVRLYRQNNPPERGHFSCNLLGDTIYVNICEYNTSAWAESRISFTSDFSAA